MTAVAIVSIEGTIDLHMHTHPCLFNRIGDDRLIAQAAAAARMQAIMLKCHHESSVSRAYLLSPEFPDLKVFGGIVLNSYVGGINPAAVEAALRLGGKAVWMPTIDAANHVAIYGSPGVYAAQKGGRTSGGEGISLLKDGRLIPEALEVIRLVAEYDVFLGTSHISEPEAQALVTKAKEMGVKKIVINHADATVPGYSFEFVRELASLGAIIEFGYCSVSPMWQWSTLERTITYINELGPARCMLVSDGGQRHNPLPSECLRIFAQCLHEKGISEDNLRVMMVDVPQFLLGLS
jgi:hypothetical protein